MNRLRSIFGRTLLVSPALVLSALPTSFTAMANETQTIEFQSGVQLGHGYNAFTGEFTEPCFVGTTVFKAHGAAKTTVEWEEATDHESVRSAFKLDASASYNAGTARASGKTTYLSTYNSGRTTVTGLALVRSETSTETLLDAKPIGTLTENDPATLRNTCGTHYVYTINYGGELYATLEQTTRSEQDRTKFSNAFNASGFRSKAGVSILTTEELEKYSNSLKLQGGMTGSDAAFPLTLQDLRTRVTNLPREMNSVAKEELLEGKRKNAPIDIVVVPIRLTQVDRDKLALLDAALKRLEALRYYRDQVEAIAMNPDSYNVAREGLDVTAQRISARVGHIENEIRTQMRNCSKAPEASMNTACNFTSIAAVPIFPGIGLPHMYADTCTSDWTPPPLGAAFEGLGKSKGDNSMGGNDTVSISATYVGDPSEGLTQTVTAKIYEANGDTVFGPKTVTRLFFDKTDSVAPSCYLTASVERSMPAGRGLMRGPNNYKVLNINSGYISKAECRSDKSGKDIGYAGCREVLFLPVRVPIDHIERINGSAPKPLLYESWLGVNIP